ncbi:MAG: hypothetical protein R3C68_16550 [Myxococcota bacterium]
MSSTVAILGAGAASGQAVAHTLSAVGVPVSLWARRQEVREELAGRVERASTLRRSGAARSGKFVGFLGCSSRCCSGSRDAFGGEVATGDQIVCMRCAVSGSGEDLV